MLITDNDLLNQNLEVIIDYYTKYISHENIFQHADIFISNDVSHDYEMFTGKPLVDGAIGVVIPPDSPDKKFTILIGSYEEIVHIALHEFTHLQDFINFANVFCNGDFSKIEHHKHKVIQSLWSEYHAKIIEIPHMNVILNFQSNMPNPKETFIDSLDWLYEQFNIKFLNKENITFYDILWYIGELSVCNIYGNKTYIPNADITNRLDFDFTKMYEALFSCQNFSDFANNLQDLYKAL